jgi:hypothetical protein
MNSLLSVAEKFSATALSQQLPVLLMVTAMLVVTWGLGSRRWCTGSRGLNHGSTDPATAISRASMTRAFARFRHMGLGFSPMVCGQPRF